MAKEMIVSVNGREKKIAILDNGRVTEFYIERGDENAGVVGNVYKGRVMRVLPGMQSAFVDIGLERDAFLYVSDFFDEDEEIERIVTSKKGNPEEAKREANEQIDRARVEREKQMESVQELAEPLVGSEPRDTGRGGRHTSRPVDEAPEEEETETREPEVKAEQPAPERNEKSRGRGRGRGRRDAEEPAAEVRRVEPDFTIDLDNSGFERISDDDAGSQRAEMAPEPVVDRVRAAEIEDEPTAEAAVGSLLAEVDVAEAGFERIADEDEVPAAEAPKPEPAKKRRSRAKAEEPAAAPEAPEAVETEEAAPETEAEEKPKKKAAAKRAPAKGKFSKTSKKKKDTDGPEEGGLADAEASESSPDDKAEMAVRRGGRGRRRGGKLKPDEIQDETLDGDDVASEGTEEAMEAGEPETDPAKFDFAEPEVPAVEAADDASAEVVADDRNRGRERGGRGGRDRERNDRERNDRDRNERDRNGRDRNARQGSDRGTGDRPNGGDDNRRTERPRGDRNDRGDRGGRGPQPTISDLLREGQEILVQIAKEPIAKKGARITSHIALPGRYLVYMPTIEHLGVSRKIESATERSRLRTMIQRIRQDADIPAGGFIVRTAGIGVAEEDLRNDAKYLAKMWAESKKGSEKKRSPALVHQDLDLVQRLLRDQLADDFTAIRVDSEEEYLRTVEFINLIQPRMVNRIKLYTREEPILEYYGVQEEIDKALKPRVWLKSGGYLVINQTEALVAIDVNTGKFVGKGNARLEDTITRTNMEAVDEIARQIRLRDLGGIIVLDLIDMEDRRNRHKVQQALQEALASDKSPTKVLSFNDFGLIIMTRKRVKQSLERTMCAPCDYCEGAGWIKSPTTVCYEILAEARRLSKSVEDVRHTTLRVHPAVVQAFRNGEREVLDEIEAYLGPVDLTGDKSVHQAQFDFAFI